MFIDSINALSYRGKFVRKNTLSQQDRVYLTKVLNSKRSNDSSCIEAIRDLPFNVVIDSLYKTKNHKHTKLLLTTEYFPFFSFITLNSKNSFMGNVTKVKRFITKFDSDIKKEL